MKKYILSVTNTFQDVENFTMTEKQAKRCKRAFAWVSRPKIFGFERYWIFKHLGGEKYISLRLVKEVSMKEAKDVNKIYNLGSNESKKNREKIVKLAEIYLKGDKKNDL